jgi:hypothetical protein
MLKKSTYTSSLSESNPLPQYDYFSKGRQLIGFQIRDLSRNGWLVGAVCAIRQ